ncbi:MAG: rod shape-determining protein [Paludibacteraceae bacterium]|nr:rod shape-determining protein [Paludibacteraceae bacterium]
MKSSLKEIANKIGTEITIFSNGKWALNKQMATAIHIGVDVKNANGCVIVDIGDTTTEVFIITGRRVFSHYSTMAVSYDILIQDIVLYMRYMHRLRINEVVAKRIWDAVGSALPDLDEEPAAYDLIGPNCVTALPNTVSVSSTEVAHCLDRNISRIEFAIYEILKSAPCTLHTDICRCGIYLTGKGASLRGLDKRLERNFDISCQIRE